MPRLPFFSISNFPPHLHPAELGGDVEFALLGHQQHVPVAVVHRPVRHAEHITYNDNCWTGNDAKLALCWRLHRPSITLSCRQRCGLPGHVWFWATQPQPQCGVRPQNQSLRKVRVFERVLVDFKLSFFCRLHLCCQSHEKVYTFSPDWGKENGFHRSWFGFGCCSSQFTVTKSWTVLACDDGLNMKRFVFKSHHRHLQKQRYLFKRDKGLMFDGGENPVEPRTLVAFPRSCERRPW